MWAEFLERHPELKQRFEYEVMKLMSEVMAHTITLHLLDAPGRLPRFQRKHPELAGRIPKKELAAYLNLTPETLSRLKQKLGDTRLTLRTLRRQETSGQKSSTSASAGHDADQLVREEDRHVALRDQHRLAERGLGAVAQHDRQHQRRERVLRAS